VLAKVGDERQRLYEDETLPGERTSDGLNQASYSIVETKKHKSNASFNKYLTFVNPANSADFLEEICGLSYHHLILSKVECSLLTYLTT
jgi:hypothetical protein